MKSFGSSTVRCSCTAPCRPSTAACAAGSVCHLSCATSHGNGFATCPRNQWKWQSHGGGTCKTKGPVMWIGNNANNSWTSRKRWKKPSPPPKNAGNSGNAMECCHCMIFGVFCHGNGARETWAKADTKHHRDLPEDWWIASAFWIRAQKKSPLQSMCSWTKKVLSALCSYAHGIAGQVEQGKYLCISSDGFFASWESGYNAEKGRTPQNHIFESLCGCVVNHT